MEQHSYPKLEPTSSMRPPRAQHSKLSRCQYRLYMGSTARMLLMWRDTSKSSAGLVYGKMNDGCVAVHAALTSIERDASSATPERPVGAQRPGASCKVALGITCLRVAMA